MNRVHLKQRRDAPQVCDLHRYLQRVYIHIHTHASIYLSICPYISISISIYNESCLPEAAPTHKVSLLHRYLQRFHTHTHAHTSIYLSLYLYYIHFGVGGVVLCRCVCVRPVDFCSWSRAETHQICVLHSHLQRVYTHTHIYLSIDIYPYPYLLHICSPEATLRHISSLHSPRPSAACMYT